MGRRFFAVVTAILLTASVVSAQWVYMNYEQITVAASAVGITATVLQPGGSGTSPQATVGVCRVATAQIRYRVDGPAPTSTVGTLAEIGDVIALKGPGVLRQFQAIRTTSTSAVLSCTVAQ